MDVARMLIRFIKKTEDYDEWIEYIEDRPFNDQRYYISNKKLIELGWKIETDFISGLRSMIQS